MFKENYIKANDSIKPDEEFLERLRDAVKQEEKHIQIQDYVEFENMDSIENYEKENAVAQAKPFRLWKRIAVAAACFLVVIGFTIGRLDWLKDGKGLGANIETILAEDEETSLEAAGTPDEKSVAQYEQMLEWFQTKQVVIYEIDSVQGISDGFLYVQRITEKEKELSVQEKDVLVADILAGKYQLADYLNESEQMNCYVAEFDEGLYVCFVIGSKNVLYIEEVFGW